MILDLLYFFNFDRDLEIWGEGQILVMSKVPIFRISKSKFLLFQEW